MDDLPVMAFADAVAWEEWLAGNHSTCQGVWLKMAKRGSGITSVDADGVVDVGLCYGWISGQRRALDEHYYLQKYVPRRRGSLWSQVNVDKVEKLIAAGRMRETGISEVRTAQADGRWAAAYPSQKTFTVPDDFLGALDARQATVFDAMDRTTQYRLILTILQARTSATRKTRIRKAARLLA